ncbi:Hypothetical protein I595_999 [Croceitalea dokdonensis DOKDO 023]|uniref:Uncharacterized protein n=1 Tax=Croceitalea dokdonensis DOKDO 023 TaxID=1300341 RepID=A0A0P7AGK4_9FLAO|nr:Hypothetical protein I595_999 [Croceitalea dokdonensis DOKDO 023]
MHIGFNTGVEHLWNLMGQSWNALMQLNGFLEQFDTQV